MSSVGARLAADVAVWGNDSVGHQFTTYANGYLVERGWLVVVAGADTTWLDC